MLRKLYEDDLTETWEGPSGEPVTLDRETAQRLIPGYMQQLGMSDEHGAAPPESGPMPERPEDRGPSPHLSGFADPSPPPAPEPEMPRTPGQPWSPHTPDQLGQQLPQVAPSLPPPQQEQWQQAAPGMVDPATGETAIAAPAPEAPPMAQEEQAKPELRPGLERAFGRQFQGAQMEADARAAEADQVASALAEQNRQLEDIQKRAAEQKAADDARIQAYQTQLDAQIKETNDMKVDRGHWWGSRTEGQKAWAVLGMALSGLGNAMKGQGGKNEAIDMIMNFIDQDVADQRYNIDKARKDIDMTRGQIGDAMQMAAYNTQGYNAMKAERIDSFKRKIEEIGARTTKDSVRANAMSIAGQLEAEYASTIEKAGNAAWQRDMAERQFRADQENKRRQRALGWANLNMRKEQAAIDAQARAQSNALKQAELQQKIDEHARAGEIVNPLTKSVIGSARVHKEAPKVANKIVENGNLLKRIASYRAKIADAQRVFMRGGSPTSMQSEKVREINGEYAILQRQIAMMLNKGALSDQDVEAIAPAIPKVQGWTDFSSPLSQIDNLYKQFREEGKDYINANVVDSKGKSAADEWANSMDALRDNLTEEEAKKTKTDEAGATVKAGSNSMWRRRGSLGHNVAAVEWLADRAMSGDAEAMEMLDNAGGDNKEHAEVAMDRVRKVELGKTRVDRLIQDARDGDPVALRKLQVGASQRSLRKSTMQPYGYVHEYLVKRFKDSGLPAKPTGYHGAFSDKPLPKTDPAKVMRELLEK